MTVGQRLRHERMRRNLSQEALAEALGTTARSVGRWESGRATPQPRHRAEYCELFGVSAEALFGVTAEVLLRQIDAGIAPPLNATLSLSHPRNPFFTGREELLAGLETAFRTTHVIALCGMGGVGKTQVATEYAHRVHEGHRSVLWMNAEGGGDIEASVAAAAQSLELREASESNTAAAAAAVRRWLAASSDWLLVLDNLVDPALLLEWLPVAQAGRVLVTCRHQATGSLAHTLALEPMTAAESVDLLLRRAKLVSHDGSSAEIASSLQRGAAEIAEVMGGLPLALDQAGAYLEETGATLSDYIALYRERRLALLDRRGTTSFEHPDSVVTTLLLSFEKLRQANPDAASLLTLCAFLYPSEIPEALFRLDPYRLGEAMASIRSFSLVQRSASRQTFSVHRLLQTVLREHVPVDARFDVAQHAVLLVVAAFARVDGIATWAERDQLFPHALAAARIAVEWELGTLESAELVRRTGGHLRTLGQLAESERFLTRALAVAEQVGGQECPEVASCLDALGSLYQVMGRYERAESVQARSQAIRQMGSRADEATMSSALNDRGTLYLRQGKYPDAEPLFRRYLAIKERELGQDDPELVVALNNLGGSAHMAGKYDDAEAHLQRALAVGRRGLGPEHPVLGFVLGNLGWLAHDMERLDQAVALLLQAERIHLITFPVENPEIANVRCHRARALHRLGRLDEADELFGQAFDTWRATLGEEHPRVARALSSLACLRDDQGRYEEAEALHVRAVRAQERSLGASHPDLATSLQNLAHHHALVNRDDLAITMYERAYGMRLMLLGAEHPATAETRSALRRLGRPELDPTAQGAGRLPDASS